MNPFFFGSGERRLFGIYSVARSAAASRPSRAVVLCHPWGPEYQYAHRSMRHLAVALNDSGIHVLRFDYFGTGDSAGDAYEASLEGWSRDIETAIEELQDTSGIKRVGLVGLRLGATFAAHVAAMKHTPVDRLVLWDPVVSGESYLRELRETTQKMPLPPRRGGCREIQGFPLTDDLSKEVGAADLPASLAAFAGHALVIVSSAGSLDPRIRALRAARPAGSLTVEEVESPAVWHSGRGLGVGAIPAQLVVRIVQWLSQ